LPLCTPPFNNQQAATMVQQPAHSIIAELEDAVRGGSSAKRVETLRQVTDLFLNDGERLSDDQVKVFDDVLCLLIARVETRAKAELSKRLAPLDYAPFEVIQHLAWDDEIDVARQRAGQFQPARDRGAGRDRQQKGAGSPARHFRPAQLPAP
jgi:uncharacterized protein (DUF2336 family)